MSESPRILVTLPEDVYRALRHLSRVSARSMSSYVREISILSLPAIRKLIEAVETAAKADARTRQGIAEAFGAAEARLSELTQKAASELDEALSAVPRRSEGGITDPLGNQSEGLAGGIEGPPMSKSPCCLGERSGERSEPEAPPAHAAGRVPVASPVRSKSASREPNSGGKKPLSRARAKKPAPGSNTGATLPKTRNKTRTST